MLRFRNLGSGSSGNCTLIEATDGTHSTRVLVDCGLGVRDLTRRLSLAGLGLEAIDGLFITHELRAGYIGFRCVYTRTMPRVTSASSSTPP